MLMRLLSILWRGLPECVRRWAVVAAQPRFTVTAGAVVIDEGGRVLLLHHPFRSGSGWGIPGGFINSGEQPEAALRRELREEIGLEVEQVELAFVRTLKKQRQVEVIFRCRPLGAAVPCSWEIDRAAWFAPVELSPALSDDQRNLIARALQASELVPAYDGKLH